ncbi:LysM peptidoglycan-binding domain-containing protein [Brevibacillus parabrevis]|uniref:LysM peptidoglycan-binding domain-containing protein n=1 Tax=Brevibacillus parabrevis TaxID=54914 RepID=UPI002E1A5426|nr:LysM peptidoglycan-binding domain-containing protein [Brevibacillus parabrevis]
MNLEMNQLPPRRSRHNRTKTSSVRFKTWVKSGLFVFGILFFGLIGFELYKANVARSTEGNTEAALETQAESNATVAKAESTPTTSESEPTSVVLPATPAETSAAAEQKGTEEATSKPAPAPVEPTSGVSAHPVPVTPVASSTPATTPKKENKKPVQTKAKPPAATATATVVQKPAETAQKPRVVKHVVQKGETLFMLSRRYFGNNSNVSRIARYNGFHTQAQLVEGKVVLVPLAP